VGEGGTVFVREVVTSVRSQGKKTRVAHAKYTKGYDGDRKRLRGGREARVGGALGGDIFVGCGSRRRTGWVK